MKTLQSKLYRAIKNYNLSSEGIVNYFYTNLVKDENFTSIEQFNFLCLSDRHSTTEEKINPKIKAKWLANNRNQLTI